MPNNGYFLHKKSLLDRFKDDYSSHTGYIQSARAEHTWNNPLTRRKRTKELNGWIKSFAGKRHIRKLSRFNAVNAGRDESLQVVHPEVEFDCLRYAGILELPNGVCVDVYPTIRCPRRCAFVFRVMGFGEVDKDLHKNAGNLKYAIHGYYPVYGLERQPSEEFDIFCDDISELQKWSNNNGWGMGVGPSASSMELAREVAKSSETLSESTDEKLGYEKGHKNSRGEDAPWVIRSHKDNRILASFAKKKDAEEHMQRMKQYSKDESKKSESYTPKKGDYIRYYADGRDWLSKILDVNADGTINIFIDDGMWRSDSVIKNVPLDKCHDYGLSLYHIGYMDVYSGSWLKHGEYANTDKEKDDIVDSLMKSETVDNDSIVVSKLGNDGEYHKIGTPKKSEAKDRLAGYKPYSFKVKSKDPTVLKNDAEAVLTEFAEDVVDNTSFKFDYDWYDKSWELTDTKTNQVFSKGTFLFKDFAESPLYLDDGVLATPAGMKLRTWMAVSDADESKKSEASNLEGYTSDVISELDTVWGCGEDGATRIAKKYADVIQQNYVDGDLLASETAKFIAGQEHLTESRKKSESKKSEVHLELIETIIVPKWLWEAHVFGKEYGEDLDEHEQEILAKFEEEYGSKYTLDDKDEEADFHSRNDFDSYGGPCYEIDVYEES